MHLDLPQSHYHIYWNIVEYYACININAYSHHFSRGVLLAKPSIQGKEQYECNHANINHMAQENMPPHPFAYLSHFFRLFKKKTGESEVVDVESKHDDEGKNSWDVAEVFIWISLVTALVLIIKPVNCCHHLSKNFLIIFTTRLSIYNIFVDIL